jgi:protein-S-isoprenylcysteine O-methyltransferase Ste14
VRRESFVRRGGLWVVAQLALLTAILVAGPFHRTASWPSVVASMPFLVMGAWLGIWGVRGLGAARSALPEPLPGARLVQEGVYARVRHPLYASLLWLSAGWTLCWLSPVSGCLSAMLFVLLWGKSRSEETRLLRRYPGYSDYRRRVPAFLPRVG